MSGRSTLFLAAGHGGADRGNIATAHVEADELLRFVGGMRRWYAANQQPAGLGGVVVLDDALDLGGQVATLNRWKLQAADRDLALDLHLDYNIQRPDGGALVLYDEHTYCRRFAEWFLARWCAGTGIIPRGCHRSTEAARRWRGWRDFGFTGMPWPGIIVELGTLNCARDFAIIQDGVYQAFAARLMVEGWQQAQTW